MFLRCHSRKKNGKRHRYWSVVESRRCRGGRPVQRQVPYLGEITDRQEAAWRKTIAVFDEQKPHYEPLSLFPSDRPIPPDEVRALSRVLPEMRLRRPRAFGDCWLGCVRWDELGLSTFWDVRLGVQRGDVLDRLLPYKDALCQFLTQQWKTLFDAQFDVLLYDLTSTYFEGQCAEVPKAKHGYSRDGRSDCRQVVIALVVTTDGLPLA